MSNGNKFITNQNGNKPINLEIFFKTNGKFHIERKFLKGLCLRRFLIFLQKKIFFCKNIKKPKTSNPLSKLL